MLSFLFLKGVFYMSEFEYYWEKTVLTVNKGA